MGFREFANQNAQYIVLAMNEQLSKKISFAISIIQSAAEQAGKAGQPLEICYSGGKDSDVILELAKMALRGGQYRAIYKNTTIDPPGTIKHCKEKGVEILQPKMTFREFIEKRGSPSRFRRHCCEVLKEYKVLDYAVVGIRRSESVKRAQRYKEPEICRVYNSKEKVRQYLPILEWTDKDVEDFILIRGIKCTRYITTKWEIFTLNGVWVASVARYNPKSKDGANFSVFLKCYVFTSTRNKSLLIRTRIVKVGNISRTQAKHLFTNFIVIIWSNFGKSSKAIYLIPVLTAKRILKINLA